MKQAKLYTLVGFLGSGKTTLLKHIATLYQTKKIAIIVNDFGDINTDLVALEKEFQHTLSVEGGSIFCSCKIDQYVDKVIECSKEDFDYIFVEGSGLANPKTIDGVLDLIDQKTNHKVIHKGTISLVDPNQIATLVETLNAAKNQIAYADLILINKMDLCEESTYQEAINIIKSINNQAKIIPTIYAKITIDEIEDLEQVKHQISYTQTIDLNVQKMTVRLDDFSKEDLQKLCEKASFIADRIKGIMTYDNVSYYVEYINHQLFYEQVHPQHRNYLVFLANTKKDLKAHIAKVVEKIQKERSNS